MGYIGGSYDGDIAIDDIEFLNCVGCKLLTIYLFHKPEQIAFDFLKNNFLVLPGLLENPVLYIDFKHST